MSPFVLDFGEVEALQTAELELVIFNDGDASARVIDLKVEPASIVNLSSTSHVDLGPGTSGRWRLRYQPTGYEPLLGTVTVEVEGEPEATVVVPVLGTGSASALSVEPSLVEFEDTPIGCTRAGQITIRNAGNRPLVLDEVRMAQGDESQGYRLPVTPPSGMVLAPGEGIPVEIEFLPLAEGWAMAQLLIYSDDLASPEKRVWLQAYGEPVGLFHQEQDQNDTNAADFLFVVHDSPEMVGVQARLSEEVGTFVGSMTAEGGHWRVGVITADVADLGVMVDDPVLLGEWGNWQSLEDQFLLGGDGGPDAEGFETTKLALMASMTDYSSPNHGFLRERAGLRVVFISDQPDVSRGPDGWSADQYLDWFRSLKLAPEHVVLSVLSGGLDGCSGAGIQAEPAPDWSAASAATGGISGSICDESLGGTMTSLGEQVIHSADTFLLWYPPVPGTVAVAVDESPVAEEDWELDVAANTIRFSPSAVPAQSQHVDIWYAPYMDYCE